MPVEALITALKEFTREFEAATRRLNTALADARSTTQDAPELKVETAPAAEAGEKYCLWCGKLLTPKVYGNGRQEPPSAFERRKLCDKTCSAKWRHSTQPESQERFRRGRKAAAEARTRKARAAKAKKQQAVPAAPAKPAPSKPAPAPRPARSAASPVRRPAPVKPAQRTVRKLRKPVDLGGPLSLPAEAQLCPTHGDRVGPFGCPACNASAQWQEGERTRRRQIAAEPKGFW